MARYSQELLPLFDLPDGLVVGVLHRVQVIKVPEELIEAVHSERGRGGRTEPRRYRQDAWPLPTRDNGTLRTPCRRSGEGGEQCSGEAYCGSDGGREEQRDCGPIELAESSLQA